PFGVSMMFAGLNGKPSLYTTDVTGNYLQYGANAIGEKDTEIKDILRKKFKKGMMAKEAITLALDIFKEVQKEGFDKERFDIGILEKDKGFVRKKGNEF
ncbi:hypothetical protein HN510_04195, partial [Candidatus Woesearchaeota archaeon]|nr:hypothetical protein [Candidatus Woesearchaeota archaeon]